MEGINKLRLSSTLVCAIYFLVVTVISVQCEKDHVFSFNIDTQDSVFGDSNQILVRRKRDVAETKEEEQDARCAKQKDKFAELTSKLSNGERLEETHEFSNETKFNLALAWAGSDDSGKLIVLTTESSFLHSASTLWRSQDHGRNWEDISKKVEKAVFRKDDGLQRNPHRSSKVYLIGYEHFLFVTEDGGDRWRRCNLLEEDDEHKDQFSVDEVLEFHSLGDYEDYVSVISNDRQLYVTYDNFQSKVEPVKRDVHSTKWGTHKDFQKSLYVTTGKLKDRFTDPTPQMYTLERMDSSGAWKTLLTGVTLFNVEGKFLYASKYKSDTPKSPEDDRLMMISTDGGDTWKEAQLPTLTKDRFYSVLDMSEDLIFMHVDNPGDTGHGVLYTSSSNGIIYSESLRNHLFPNYNTIHDFYRVKSMRGVYLASQMGNEASIHTVITYNRGGEWKQVPRPVGLPCENDESEGCYLQIHNSYSIHRGIKAKQPHSIAVAYGLLIVHAHIAKNLQTSDPDVYLSNDGGYTFRKVLEGPHAYEIADSGGLLLAVPLHTDTPNTIKFSTDEGRCWHNYQFTDKSLRFTGLLTEPGGKSMTVSIWGYTVDTKKWTVNTIDFGEVVTDQCRDTDYETWMPHTSLHKGTEHEGCLLGQKETFSRIKHDSWCRNGYNKHMVSVKEVCMCTKDDYECDYGFHRPVGQEKCVRQHGIKSGDIEICNGNQLDSLITLGYRLVPGDVCDVNNPRSFHPSQSKEVTFDAVCHFGDGEAAKHNFIEIKTNTTEGIALVNTTQSGDSTHSGSGSTFVNRTIDRIQPTSTLQSSNSGSNALLIVAIVVGVVIILGVFGGFMIYKMVLLRRHKVVYRYSMLNQGDDARDNEYENALVSHDTLYNDTSDDEVEANNVSPERRQNSSRGGGTAAGLDFKKDLHGYHDDSDDDMLA